MTLSPALSVIIPVYNKWELTSACLRSLYEHTPEYDYEVIVVDNASGDATAAELPLLGASLFGTRFRRIRFAENRNFGPACNAGAAAASGPLLFFLNNDTLLTPGWAPPLLKALEDNPRLGGAGPLLLYDNDTVQHLGVACDICGVEHLYRGWPSDHPVVRKRRLFQVITAAALLMPAAVFRKHEGFYEAYRNGFEDVDLCLRIHATGKKFTCIPESVIYHLESQSPGRLDSETGNATLLSARCGHLFRPDKHRIVQDDGFEFFIDDGFGISFRLPKRNSDMLFRQAEGRSCEFLEQLVRKHPLWSEGRKCLAREYERGGRIGEALVLYSEIARTEMRIEPYERFIQKAAHAGNGKARTFAEAVCRILRNRTQNRGLALKILRDVRAKRIADLEKLFEQIVRERF